MRQLAAITPIHKSSLSEIENGKMNFHNLALKKIADTLKGDVKTLASVFSNQANPCDLKS